MAPSRQRYDHQTRQPGRVDDHENASAGYSVATQKMKPANKSVATP